MGNRTSVIKTLLCALILHVAFALSLSGAIKTVPKYTGKLTSVGRVELRKVRYGIWQIESLFTSPNLGYSFAEMETK